MNMVNKVWSIVLFTTVVATVAVTSTHDAAGTLITPMPDQRELHKRYVYPVYYHPNWPNSTTCGWVNPILAAQNGLYGTTTAASITAQPSPVVCGAACANSGNYLGCIDWTSATVATTCTDYIASNSECRYMNDGPCYWDQHCSSASPYCNQYIYSGSITQFWCGSSKYSPIPVESATMMSFTPAIPTTSSRTSAPTSTSSADSNSDVSGLTEALRNAGLSVGAFSGIIAGALVLCCGGCCGFLTWKKRRDARRKYAAPYTHEPVNPAVYVQQPLMGQPPAYHTQYHQKQPDWTTAPVPRS